jgi:hypothetical protein
MFVGDLFQLPPVVSQADMQVLSERGYEGPYFFCANALHRKDVTMVELSKIFRQKDVHFAGLLNQIRINQDIEEALDTSNQLTLKTGRQCHICGNRQQFPEALGKSGAFLLWCIGLFPSTSRRLGC